MNMSPKQREAFAQAMMRRMEAQWKGDEPCDKTPQGLHEWQSQNYRGVMTGNMLYACKCGARKWGPG